MLLERPAGNEVSLRQKLCQDRQPSGRLDKYLDMSRSVKRVCVVFFVLFCSLIMSSPGNETKGQGGVMKAGAGVHCVCEHSKEEVCSCSSH